MAMFVAAIVALLAFQTPWDTLAANGLTRWSLLSELRAAGCALPATLLRPPGADPGHLLPTDLSYEVRRL